MLQNVAGTRNRAKKKLFYAKIKNKNGKREKKKREHVATVCFNDCSRQARTSSAQRALI